MQPSDWAWPIWATKLRINHRGGDFVANRRYSQFSDRRPAADEPQPSPGNVGTPQPTYDSETTANWPGAPGPKGTGFNKVGYPEVKAYAKQDLADDKWIAGAIRKPGALHRQLGVPMGEKIPAKKLAAAAQKGGKLGKRARLAETLKGFNKK